MSAAAWKRDPFQVFLVVACLALATLVVLLAWQNRRLKVELSAAHSQREVPKDALKEGDVLEPIDLLAAVTGQKLRLSFDGGGDRTLLLVFSSTCPACKQTFPVWNEVLGAASASSGIRVVGVQTDLAAAGPLGDVVRFPVYGFDGARPPSMKKFPFIPAATLLDARGRALKVWVGVPDDAVKDELRRLLGG